jgi:hypothetical protein
MDKGSVDEIKDFLKNNNLLLTEDENILTEVIIESYTPLLAFFSLIKKKSPDNWKINCAGILAAIILTATKNRDEAFEFNNLIHKVLADIDRDLIKM